MYADLTGAGYRGQQPPYDAFWGARYAVVEDPDGNAVGLMSPSDPALPQRPGTAAVVASRLRTQELARALLERVGERPARLRG